VVIVAALLLASASGKKVGGNIVLIIILALEVVLVALIKYTTAQERADAVVDRIYVVTCNGQVQIAIVTGLKTLMNNNLTVLGVVNHGTLEEKSAVRYVVGMIMGSIKDIAKDIPASLMLVVAR